MGIIPKNKSELNKMHTYGVISKKDGGHIDVSNTEIGAKRYATKHGYNQVSIRYNGGYVAKIIAEKRNSRWVKPKEID